MTWVKQNYDRFFLALAAFVLLTCAVVIFLQAHNFNSVFQSLRDPVVHSKKIPAVDVARIANETQKLAAPDRWEARMTGANNERRVTLFVSQPYIEKTEVDPNGETKTTLVDPFDESVAIHPPVPNAWFIKYNQDLLSTGALNEDTDGDGFTALDEWKGKTDPNDKNSHPPYITKLFLKEFKRIPFRLLFAARNGETILLNTLDIDAPTQFLKKGSLVAGTKFKVLDLKISSGKVDGLTKDTSVVTLVNTETGEKIELPKEVEVDSPSTYAQMIYVWAGRTFDLHKGEDFSLKPEDTVKYHCTDISATAVQVVKVGTNEKFTIGKQPAS